MLINMTLTLGLLRAALQRAHGTTRRTGSCTMRSTDACESRYRRILAELRDRGLRLPQNEAPEPLSVADDIDGVASIPKREGILTQ
jgi:hypothetical protein